MVMSHKQRMRQWNHNALLGAAGMIEACARRIEESPTTNERAKYLAASIRLMVPDLKKELKERIDE